MMEIDCHTVKAKLDTGDDLLLLDCREQEEVQTVTIDGSVWIPMSEIEQRRAELEPHRQREIVVYCHLGGRSLQVAQWLCQQGFDNVQSMAGGIERWAEAVDPSLARY